MALSPLWSLVGITMLVMTAGVSVDAHRRHKYATPWFAVVAVLGLFGVLFYYVTIRTEEVTETISAPSRRTVVVVAVLTLVGTYPTALAALQIAAVLDPGSSIVLDPGLLGATLFPAVAVVVALSCDFSWGTLPRLQLFAECLFAFVVGSVAVLFVFPEEFVTQYVPYRVASAAVVLVALSVPVGWYRHRRRAVGRTAASRQ